MGDYNTKVTDYIAKAPEFAQPVLNHLRQLVHSAAPQITESIKWGFPFFDYKGPVANMAAFKQHCAFGFWKASMLDDPQKLINQGEPSAGSFGKIQSLADLPDDETLAAFIMQAIAINERGEVVPKKVSAPKAAIEMPADFADLLAQNAAAKEVYEKFSPSHKREYLEWIVEAKTEATRIKRMSQAIEQIVEGKSKNWKYQK